MRRVVYLLLVVVCSVSVFGAPRDEARSRGREKESAVSKVVRMVRALGDGLTIPSRPVQSNGDGLTIPTRP